MGTTSEGHTLLKETTWHYTGSPASCAHLTTTAPVPPREEHLSSSASSSTYGVREDPVLLPMKDESSVNNVFWWSSPPVLSTSPECRDQRRCTPNKHYIPYFVRRLANDCTHHHPWVILLLRNKTAGRCTTREECALHLSLLDSHEVTIKNLVL